MASFYRDFGSLCFFFGVEIGQGLFVLKMWIFLLFSKNCVDSSFIFDGSNTINGIRAYGKILVNKNTYHSYLGQ